MVKSMGFTSCGNVFVASPWACTTAGWWMPSVLRHIVILEQRRICKKRIKRLKSYVGYLLCNTYLGCRARKQRFRVTRFLKLDSPPHYLYLIINILLLLIQISRWELSSHLVFILARIHQKPPKCSICIITHKYTNIKHPMMCGFVVHYPEQYSLSWGRPESVLTSRWSCATASWWRVGIASYCIRSELSKTVKKDPKDKKLSRPNAL